MLVPEANLLRPALWPRTDRRPRIRTAIGIAAVVSAMVTCSVAGYAAWELWGTGLGTARAQRVLRAETLAARHAPEGSSASAYPGRIREGSPVAVLSIPRIHLDIVVVQGTSPSDLAEGPGHAVGTSLPWERTGRVLIFGHRTTYLHPFWALDRLRAGDLIRLKTRYGTYDYRATSHAVVGPDAGWVFRQTPTPTLALVSCTPRFSARYRLVVLAERISAS